MTHERSGADLDSYLAMLTGNGRARGWLEVRYRTRTGMRTLFYPARRHRRSSLEQLLANVSQHRDVYIGCAIRRIQRSDKGALAGAWVLWAELDTPDADRALEAFAKPPSMVIASGTRGHRHAYWALDRPASVDAVEDANRRLAHALDADRVCYDAARILRPPGTLSHKHQPPAPVTLEAIHPRRVHNLDALAAELPTVPAESKLTNMPNQGGRTREPLLTIPPDVYVPALTNRQLGRDHKVSCPLHEDRTPSLHAYPTPEQGWYCFGCRRGGSIFDLAAALWSSGQPSGETGGVALRGSDFVEVRRRLLAMFFAYRADTE